MHVGWVVGCPYFHDHVSWITFEDECSQGGDTVIPRTLKCVSKFKHVNFGIFVVTSQLCKMGPKTDRARVRCAALPKVPGRPQNGRPPRAVFLFTDRFGVRRGDPWSPLFGSKSQFQVLMQRLSITSRFELNGTFSLAYSVSLTLQIMCTKKHSF